MKKLLFYLLITLAFNCTTPEKFDPIIGIDGISCWDSNGDGIGNQNEDVNQDGSFNNLDCQGSNGENGENGNNGLSCWDLNGNGVGDPQEDVNNDGNFNADDCQGGSGTNGNDGYSCWDLNQNGLADSNEDTNNDGNIDILDCRGQDGNDGSDGTNGEDGQDGENGISCWDLNGNGMGDSEEDFNGDGNFDASDCRGEDGDNCWDAVGDYNGDGVLNGYDCIHYNQQVCTTVQDTDYCKSSNVQYVIWIKNKHTDKIEFFDNISLHFIQYEDIGEAILCGKVVSQSTNKRWNVNFKYSGRTTQNDHPKDHVCQDDLDTSDWVYYTELEGEMVRVDGKKTINTTRRGEPFQYGTGANVTTTRYDQENGSGWWDSEKYWGDTNFDKKCL